MADGQVQTTQRVQAELIKFQRNGKIGMVGVLKSDDRPLDFIRALVLIDRFNQENRTHVRLVSPETADYLLLQTDKWRGILGSQFILNQFIAYEVPNEPFRHDLELTTGPGIKGRLIIPKILYNVADIALVVNDLHALGITEISSNYFTITVPDELVTIMNMPVSNGWRTPNPINLIPYRELVEKSQSARFLSRDEGSYAGPTGRHVNFSGGRQDILACQMLSDLSYVVVELPLADRIRFDGYNCIPFKSLGKHARREVMAGNVVEIEIHGSSRIGYIRSNPDGSMGGFVELSVGEIDRDVIIAPNAMVLDFAKVLGTIKVLDNTIVCEHATITGSGELCGDNIYGDGDYNIHGRVSNRRHHSAESIGLGIRPRKGTNTEHVPYQGLSDNAKSQWPWSQHQERSSGNEQ